jgi:hypothetical protein
MLATWAANNALVHYAYDAGQGRAGATSHLCAFVVDGTSKPVYCHQLADRYGSGQLRSSWCSGGKGDVTETAESCPKDCQCRVDQNSSKPRVIAAAS